MPPPNPELLRLDYEKTLATVDKLDNCLLQIQNWAVVSCGSVLCYGVDKKSLAFTTATMLLSFCFYFVAHIYKTFQIDAMNHTYALEILLHAERPDPGYAKHETQYVFGIGHAIRPLTDDSLFKTMGHPKLWHFRGFFFLFAMLAVVA